MCVLVQFVIDNTDVDVDVHVAFVYIKPPHGYPALPPGMVLKLNMALYGLKQSPHEWNATLNNYLCHELKIY